MEPLTHIQCDVLFMEMCTAAPVILELLAYKMEFFTHFLPQGRVLASMTNAVSLTTPQPISVQHTHISAAAATLNTLTFWMYYVLD